MHNELNSEFKNEFVKMIRNDNSVNYDALLRYAFYLLISKKDELSLSFAYSIVLHYTKIFEDYKPLAEFSIIFGYSPILELIYNREFRCSSELENALANFYIENNRYNNKILTSGQKIIYRLINEKNDYSVVAPTSYGKTDLMIESAFNAEGDVILIVPLVALLNQVKSDIYNYGKSIGKKVKVITHQEIKPSKNFKNIYVLTQERCYQIIKKNGFENLSDLFIDEAHKLLLGESRSYKLAEVIFLLKKKYNVSVKYYSPVLRNANSIKIKGLYNSDIKAIQDIRDMKNYTYFFYHRGKKKIYIPNTNRMDKNYIIDENYKDSFDYIIRNGKNKNILFYNSPKEIEKNALELAKILNGNCSIGQNEIIDFIGKEYYIYDTLKSGVLYIHGQMPDIVRFYLLDLYRNTSEIKYLVTNSSILEGINTPSDSLFICNYAIGGSIMKPMDFLNLRGRINRIADIVKSRDIFKLICETHFIVETDSKKNKVKNKIIDPCYNNKIDDFVMNEFLEDFKEDDGTKKDEFIDSITKISIIDNSINIEQIFNQKPNTNYNNNFVKMCLMNDIRLNEKQIEGIGERVQRYADREIDSISDLLECIDDIFRLNDSSDISLSRLSILEARRFYGMLFDWLIQGKTIKEKAGSMTGYYLKRDSKDLIFVGKSRGELSAELYNGRLTIQEDGYSKVRRTPEGYPVRLSKLWVYNSRNRKELYNLCIVKIKVEEDFISYSLMPFIETLYESNENIISSGLYNLIKYKTLDQFEMELIKEGLSAYLAKALNSEKYRKYIILREGLFIDKGILNVFFESDILKAELELNI